MPEYADTNVFRGWPSEEIRSIRSIGGGHVKVSENYGAYPGKWCQACRKIGKYSWVGITDGYGACPALKLGWHDKNGNSIYHMSS
jgi:hypothetical protein